jgi:DNA-binding response OmpR family regulator
VTALRAYECGSDHHIPQSSGYMLLRAILESVARRVLEDASARHLHVGDIHIDLAARTVTASDTLVGLSPLEFNCSSSSPATPTRVFSKHELARCIWRQQRICERTVDSHIARLRGGLAQAEPTRYSSTNGAKAGRSPHRSSRPVRTRLTRPAAVNTATRASADRAARAMPET